MHKALKIFLIIIASVAAALITLHISVVGICWGLDIFKIKDLADFIGWDNIEYVTANDTGIKLILQHSAYYNIDNAKELSDTEKIFAHLEEINNFIKENEHYKDKKITIQYGERLHDLIGLSNVLSFANHSLTGRENELYEGFYSVMCEMGNGIGFENFNEAPRNNVQEIAYMNYFLPTDIQAIENLTKLEYVYFREDLDEEIYNELCTYAPWCEIEVR